MLCVTTHVPCAEQRLRAATCIAKALTDFCAPCGLVSLVPAPSRYHRHRNVAKTISIDEEDQLCPFVSTALLEQWEELVLGNDCPAARAAFAAAARRSREERRRGAERQAQRCGAQMRRWCCHGKAFWCCGPRVTLAVAAWKSPSFREFHRFVTSRGFDRVIVCAIIANAVVLMMFMYPVMYERAFGTFYSGGPVEYDTFERVLEGLNFLFSWVFLIECILKNVALGFRDYLHDGFNVFDGAVVAISIVDIIFTSAALAGNATVGDAEQASAWIVLRTLRLFRILKLARAWKQLRTLLAVVGRTLSEVGLFLVLLGLFMFVFAMLGQSLFSNRMRFDALGYRVDLNRTEAFFSEAAAATTPRSHFDDLATSCLVVFQVLTGENWNVVMYDCARAAGLATAAVYFVVLIVLGAMIVLELFVAILLVGFGYDDGEEDKVQRDSHNMQLLVKSSVDAELTEALRLTCTMAPFAPQNALWEGMGPAVQSTADEDSWRDHVVVLHGMETFAASARPLTAEAVPDLRSIVDDCCRTWRQLREFGDRAKAAGATAVLFLSADNDPFTLSQLRTIDSGLECVCVPRPGRTRVFPRCR